MKTFIDLIMRELNIELYWLVTHNIKLFNCSYIEKNFDKYVNNTDFQILFFVYNEKIGKIEFNNVSYDGLKKLIKKYVDNNESFCAFNGTLDIYFDNEYNKCDYIDDYNEQVGILQNEMEMHVRNEKKDIIECTYIQDNVTLNYKFNIKKRYHRMCTINIYRKSINYNGAFCFGKPYKGIINDILKNVGVYSTDTKLIKNLQNEIVTFSQETSGFLVKLFLQLFDGEKIMNNCSLIDIYCLGKQMIPKEITIKDTFDENERKFDDEGIRRKDKVLVENGIIKDFFNNIKSASYYKLESGNAYYDYFAGYNVNKYNRIKFDYNANEESDKKSELYVTRILDKQVIIDSDTGFVRMFLLAEGEDGTNYNCMIYKNIFELFNCIIGICGDYQEHEGCIVPKIIFDLGGKR